MTEIEIKQSAYKHGCTHDDIINCYRFPIITKILKIDESKYLYIGLDTKELFRNNISIFLKRRTHLRRFKKIYIQLISEQLLSVFNARERFLICERSF